jgi:hypothetical protein
MPENVHNEHSLGNQGGQAPRFGRRGGTPAHRWSAMDLRKGQAAEGLNQQHGHAPVCGEGVSNCRGISGGQPFPRLSRPGNAVQSAPRTHCYRGSNRVYIHVRRG